MASVFLLNVFCFHVTLMNGILRKRYLVLGPCVSCCCKYSGIALTKGIPSVAEQGRKYNYLRHFEKIRIKKSENDKVRVF